MNYESLLELVKKRRSTRRFKPDPIPDEYVDKIIEAARWAPSGFNSQPWDFIVVKKPEYKDKISQLVSEYGEQSVRMEATREPWQRISGSPIATGEMTYKNAPVFIILLGDNRARAGLPMAVRFDQLRWLKIHISGLAHACVYMHLAATALGLASQWISAVATPYIQCMVKDLLGIPADLEPYEMMAVGYPAVKTRPKLMRPKDKMIHHDYCGKEDFRTDEEVNDFIKRTRTWVMATTRRRPDPDLIR